MPTDNAQVTAADHRVQTTYTPEQAAQLQAFQNLGRQAQSPTFNANDPNKLVFFVAFDGTGNNRFDDSRPETNVSRIERAVKTSVDTTGQGATFYSRGPGTQADSISAFTDTISGASVRTSAREGYDAFAEYVRANPDKQVTVSGIGFSRGSATLSVFINTVYNEGVPDLTSARSVGFVNGKEVISYDRYLIQPGDADFGLMVMQDRVATGVRGLPLDLPPSQSLRVLSIQAQDERDNFFRLDSFRDKTTGALDPRVTEVWIPGVHSDIASGYANNGVGLRVLDGIREFIASSGQPIGTLRAQDSYEGKPLDIHNSFGGRRGVDDPNYGPGVGGWVSESRDENSVRYNNPPRVIDELRQNFDDGSYRVERTYADGTRDILVKDELGKPFSYEVTRPVSGGVELTVRYDANKKAISSTTVQRFDDEDGQSRIETITFADGSKSTKTYDTQGNVITDTYRGRVEGEPVPELVPRSAEGYKPVSFSTVVIDGKTYTQDGNGDYAINLGDGQREVYDSRIGKLYLEVDGERSDVSATQRVVLSDTGVASIFDTAQAQPAVIGITSPDTTATLNDIASLVAAIQGGRPLPILNSGLHLVNTLSSNSSLAVANATTLVSGLSSLYNLSNALEHGDTLTQINATLSTLNYVNSALPSLLGSGPLSAGLDSFLNGSGAVYNAAADGLVSGGAFNGLASGGAPGVLPVLGLIISIKNGDPIGTVSGLIGLINPALLTGPVGWVLAGAAILNAVLNNHEPPEAWGSAKFVFDENGQVRIDTVGEAFGPDRVRNQLAATQSVLNSMIGNAQLSSPNTPLGIIAQRTPTITWREARQSDKGYALVDIDPVTGTQRYPYLRFDDNGLPFSSNPAVWQPDPTDPGIRVSMTQQLIESALRREAIAAKWEVDTAKIQQDVGDPNAGLTEQERAAKLGLGATYDKTTNKPMGQFRPVTLDLDNTGTISTEAKDAATNFVGFDWDGSGFKKQVAWVKPNDGFLFLDRNANGVVDRGNELLSNSLVSDNYKGVRSLDWVDANRDGKITNVDPVFKELKVWRDVNGDGDSITILADGGVVQDAGELKSLSELGITELDYVNGRFTRNGELFALKSDQLEADSEGSRINVVNNGIVIDYSNGTSQFIVSKVTSLAGGADRVNGLFEDGNPYGSASTVPQEIAIAASLLLANDAADPAGLSIVSVNGATHGTVRLGDLAGQPTVFFTPEANYNSGMGAVPKFEYVVKDANGAQKTVRVELPLTAVNDIPTVSVQLDQRSIYGYGVISHIGSAGYGEDRYSTTNSELNKGLPFFNPYYTVLGRKQNGTTRVGYGEDSYDAPAFGDLVDAHIPKAYFDEELSKLVAYYSQPENGPVPSSFNVTLDGTLYQLATDAGTVLHDIPLATIAWNDGFISAVDPDGPASFSYEIVQQGLYGNATINPTTGRFEYTGRRYVAEDVRGASVGRNVDTDDASRDEERFTDVITVRVHDGSGGDIDKNVAVTHFGPRPTPEVQSGGGKKPIAVDLDGDGFHFTDVNDSNVFLDVNGDGWKRKVAWISPGDGLLAFDENGNGKIDSGLEISFARFKKGAQTDLEGLRAFDTNGDGKFTAADAKWGQFGIWQDSNSNGVTDADEFKNLSDMGVSEIALTSDGQFRVINGQTVHGVGNLTKTDGSMVAIADVTLKYSDQLQTTDGTTPTTSTLVTAQKGQTFTGTADKDLVLGTVGSDSFIMGAGDDAVVDDQGDDVVDAGAGNDLINTGMGNDVVLAGAGNDTVFAGAGNDVVFGDDGAGNGDDVIMLQGGNDVAFGGAGNDFISGGSGNDIISGDAGNDQLFGEDGWDVLLGKEGNDELRGMDGNDVLDGGDGNDLLDGGAGTDVMQGGAGDDIYVVDVAADVLDETIDGQVDGTPGTGDAGGNDTARASVTYTLGALLENLTLTGDAALNGTGNSQANVLIGNSANNTLYGLGGNDSLDGGLGADTLVGGTGDDTYVVDNTGDVVVEAASEGTDTVRSRISHTLTTNVENLTLIGINAVNGAGNSQANTLIGNAAANVLDGGAGNDVLSGGKGNDSYVFGRGYGVDTIIDKDGQNTLVFGTDINATDLRFSLGGATGTDLLIDVTQDGTAGVATADRVVLQDWYLGNTSLRPSAQRVSAVRFADGTVVPLDESALNHTPTVVADSAAIGEDTPLVAGNVLANDSDPDEGNVLTVVGAGTYVGQYGTLVLAANGSYSYSLRSGDADVQGLRNGQVVTDSFAYSVTDNALFERATIGSNLTVTVQGSNDTPVLAQSVSAQAATESVAFSLALPAGIFTDADAGDTLSLVATSADGSPLPTWLSFNPQTATFSGEPAYEDISAFYGQAAQALSLRVTATDSQGASANAVFDLTVNQSPELILVGTDGADALRGASRNDQLFGGGGNDTLRGMRGDDLLDGGTGADIMIGGLGDDRYVVDDADDVVIEFFNQGYDQVSSSINYVLPDQVEILNLTGNAITGTGNALGNVLLGNALANILDGGAGADSMSGAAGDDRYIVDNAGDQVVEASNEGNDTVYASDNYSTAANVENLVLAGQAITATGNGLNNVLVGNDQSNSLVGGDGADLLAGWLGDDNLDGGIGNDTYLWNQGDGRDTITDASGADAVRFGAGISLNSLAAREYTVNGQRRVFISVLDTNGEERADQGIDFALIATTTAAGTVYSSPLESFKLTDGSSFTLDQVKPALVTTYGGNGNDTLTGSRADDTMDGSNGSDILYGRSGNDTLYGSNGQDKLFGEGGNDKLYGGNDGDWLQGGTGNDVLAGENGKDTLLGGAGNDKLNGGNDADILDGGTGSDELVGDNGEDELWAGDGNDALYGGNDGDLLAGGAGDDILYGDNGADVMVAGAGNDTIWAGNDSDFIDAGAGNDTINTDQGNDFIAGGKGNDTINAGQGSDVIAFNRGDGQDTLLSMDWQQDTLSLGGGIRYADMTLSKSGNDLVLGLGQDDQITLKDWYVGSYGIRNQVNRLQMLTGATGGDYSATSADRLLNKKVVDFDFLKLVSDFDAARALNPNLGAWAVPSKLNNAYLAGSSTQAIGGDLAYGYGTFNDATTQSASYGDLDWKAVRSRMGSMGSSLQNLSALAAPTVNPWAALQAGTSLIVEQSTGASLPIQTQGPMTQDQLVTLALNSQQQISAQAKPSWV